MRSATSGLAKVITTQLACAIPPPDVFQHLDLAGVAINDRIAGLPAGANAVRIQFEGNEFEARLFEHPRNILPYAAETADDDVFAPGDRQSRPGFAQQFAVRRAGFAEQPTSDAAIVPNEDGR